MNYYTSNNLKKTSKNVSKQHFLFSFTIFNFLGSQINETLYKRELLTITILTLFNLYKIVGKRNVASPIKRLIFEGVKNEAK